MPIHIILGKLWVPCSFVFQFLMLFTYFLCYRIWTYGYVMLVHGLYPWSWIWSLEKLYVSQFVHKHDEFVLINDFSWILYFCWSCSYFCNVKNVDLMHKIAFIIVVPFPYSFDYFVHKDLGHNKHGCYAMCLSFSMLCVSF
jgi:hypothetical protein